jgi:hypothetical protein
VGYCSSYVAIALTQRLQQAHCTSHTPATPTAQQLYLLGGVHGAASGIHHSLPQI